MSIRMLAFVPLFVALTLMSSTSIVFGRQVEGGCPAGDAPAVRGLFGVLIDRLGPTAGTPVGCLSDAADGGLSLTTTTGLLYARPEQGGPVRIVVFTDGHRHWAMDAALSQVTLYWEGDSPYPPAQGVARQPASGPNGQAPAPWPVAPVPTVGRAPAPPAPAYRPETGENLIPPTYTGGRGTLKIKNDFPQDLALKLRDTDGARAARAFIYVRNGEEATLEGIRPGAYEVQTIVGVAWDQESKRFGRGLLAFKMDEPAVFEEEETAEGVRWMNRTLTLYAVSEAASNASPLDLEEFMKD